MAAQERQRATTPYLCLFILTALTLTAFSPTLRHDFVNFDDDLYVTNNPVVQQGLTFKGVCWAFTTGHAANWHPLTWLSHMLDCSLFGMAPWGHHLTNLLLHLGSTLLLFRLLARLTGAPWRSFAAAALFAVHPLHVESVAWVAERKDVLSGLFAILTLMAYAAYARRGGAGRYLLTAALFALGLMAKPMLVTLPLLMVLFDVWPLGRIRPADTVFGLLRENRRPILEKIPLLALSAASALVTILVQTRGGATGALHLSLAARLANASLAFTAYLGQMLWPANLAVFYPHPGGAVAWIKALAAAVALAAASIAAIAALLTSRRAGSWRYAAVGWLWFVISLAPVSGIIQFGEQAHADRYTYLSLIGIFIILSWGSFALVEAVFRTERTRRVTAGVALTVVLTLCTAATWRQACFWHSSETLWRHAISAMPRNALAHVKLGNVLSEAGQIGAAEEQFRQALEANPRSARAFNNLGMLRLNQGKPAEAIDFLNQALAIEPGHVRAHINMGIALASLQRLDEAMDHFAQALAVAPNSKDAHFNLATAHYLQADFAKAKTHFARALELAPTDVDARNGLALTLLQQGKQAEAAEQYRILLQYAPNHPEATRFLQSVP